MTGSTEPPDRRWRRVARRGIVTTAGWYGLVFVAFWIAVIVSPATRAAGSCGGFSCGGNPRSDLIILGIFFGVPLLAFSLLVSCVTLWVAVAAGGRSGVVAGTVAAVVGFAVALAIPVFFLLS